MPFTRFKWAIVAVWLLAVGVVGALLPVTSVTGWITIVGFGLTPAIFMLRAWREPTPTMSESIRAQTRD